MMMNKVVHPSAALSSVTAGMRRLTVQDTALATILFGFWFVQGVLTFVRSHLFLSGFTTLC